MKIQLLTILLMIGLVLIQDCKKDDEGPTEPETPVAINPSDANALAGVLVIPGAQANAGNAPAPSGTPDAPVISGGQTSTQSSNGSTAQFPFTYSTQSNVAGCYVQVVGAGSYFNVPYSASSGTSGQIVIPVTIPTNVSGGSFGLTYCVYNSSGLVSNYITTNVAVLQLGTGTVQVSLSWDATPDIDLYVTDPTGEEISYMNTVAQSGGELDRDDTDGFGPENIFWAQTAPDGTYKVEVDYFSGSVPTNYVVTVNAVGSSRTYNGSLSSGKVLVVNFTKSGNAVSFDR